MKMSETLK